MTPAARPSIPTATIVRPRAGRGLQGAVDRRQVHTRLREPALITDRHGPAAGRILDPTADTAADDRFECVDGPEPQLAGVRVLDDRAAERMLAGAFERCHEIDQ